MKYTLIEALDYIKKHSNRTITSIGYDGESGYKFYYTTTDNPKPQHLHIPVNYSIKPTENKHEIL
jgi:hypothetical protein